MSIDDNNPVDTDDTSLDDFSAEFFGRNDAEPTPTKVEDSKPEEKVVDAPNEDEDTQETEDAIEDDDVEENESDEDEDETKEEEETPKPKKNRFQERISELTAKAREAERREQETAARLAALEARLNKDEPTSEPTAKVAATEGDSPPAPTDMNEDGTEKYPLGEFDPGYITDLTRYNVDKAFAEREAQAERDRELAKRQEAVTQIEANWNTELESARERYPDFDDKGQTLSAMFTSLDPSYGDYLGTTIMSMEKGADVLYYLANNPEEAMAIVNSGPQKATIALGRLEARFDDGEASKPAPRKVSKAPTPPPVNKGSSVARGRVAPDTDDLDAFEQVFFNKK